MIWSLETDDFRGICSGIKYPILTAINEIIRGGDVSNNGGTVSKLCLCYYNTSTLTDFIFLFNI